MDCAFYMPVVNSAEICCHCSSTVVPVELEQKEKGALQHSSFLAGAAITAAGRLRVKHGIIKVIIQDSTHAAKRIIELF